MKSTLYDTHINLWIKKITSYLILVYLYYWKKYKVMRSSSNTKTFGGHVKITTTPTASQPVKKPT